MDGGQFRTVTETSNHYDTILNYFINRSTNTAAESFNAKVKAFRSQFRGVTDVPILPVPPLQTMRLKINLHSDSF